MRKGVTIIELLLAVGIIAALFLSVNLENITGFIETGRLSSLRYMSSQATHFIGDECKLRMDFEEGEATSTAAGCGSGPASISGAVWVEGVEGDYALELDGADDHVRVDNVPELSGKWTLEAWVYPHSLSQDAMFLSKGRVYMRIRDRGEVELRWEEPDGTNVWVQTPDDILLLSKWNHVVGTHDGEKARIFVNGRERAKLESTSYSVPADWWYVGRATSDSEPRHFDGAIDNVRFYSAAWPAP